MKQLYPWRRFWLPEDVELTLENGAYLPDPEDDYGKFLNQDISSFSEIRDLRCTILLGEPGMGKSISLTAEFESARPNNADARRNSLLIDMGSVRTLQDVSSKIQANSQVAAWTEGSGSLHLCLDSLDEALPAYSSLPKALIEILKELPLERLFLSVACRAGQFPRYLDQQLPLLFGEESVSRRHLAPLRQKDILLALERNGLDANKFMRGLSKGGIEALAARPVTLDLLIGLAEGNSELPKDVWSLYEKGCQHLLSEHPDSTRDPLLPLLSIEQKMAVAGRIACVMVLGAFAAADAGSSRSSGDHAITSAALAGGQERVGGTRFDVNEPVIAGVLKMGLFTASDLTFRWCHKSFSEFLAAYHVRTNSVAPSQVNLLLTRSGKVPPALRGVCAWLTQKDDTLFEKILTIDPEALFSGDLRSASDPQKEQLIEWLTKEAENDSPLIHEWHLSLSYSSLKHCRLSLQLGTVIDRSRSLTARHLAIIIATANRETGLQSLLTDLALDESQPMVLRIESASFVARCGNGQEKARLIPLALESSRLDAEQRLQASALAAVWPEHYTWSQVRTAVASIDPKTTTSIGRFLAFEFPQRVPEESLPEVLHWLAQLNPECSSGLSAWAVATDKLLNKAVRLSPNRPEMQQAIAAVLAARLSKHYRLFCDSGMFPKEAERWPTNARREIAARLAPLLIHNSNAAFGVCRGPNPLLDRADLKFAVGRWKNSLPTESQMWETIVELVADWEDEGQITSIVAELGDHPALQTAIESWQQRRRLNAELSRLERANEDATRHSKIQERTAELLQLLSEANSDTTKFTQLLWCASCELSEDSTFGVLQRRVSEFPGWQVLTLDEQERFLTAGQSFLERERPILFRSLRSHTYTRGDHAGYAILRELMAVRPSITRQLPIEVLQKWMPVILLCQCWISDDKYSPADKDLLALTALDAERLGRILSVLIRKGRTLDLDRQLGRFADASLPDSCNARLLDALRKSSTYGVYLTGMRLLLRHSYGPAIEAIKSIQRSSSFQPDRLNRHALNAALWIEQDCKKAWSAVWPLMQIDPQFAREVLDVLIGEKEVRLIQYVAPSLTEKDLGEVFLWLRKQFGPPPAMPPIESRAESVSQYAIIANLTKRGTAGSVAVLKEIEQQLYLADDPPQIQEKMEFRKSVWEAERTLLEATWEPLDSNTVLRIIEDRRQLLVRDQQELAEAVLLALEDYQNDIRDEGSRVMRLWNEDRYRPKPEESVSREIAEGIRLILHGRGVQATCEPKMRSGQFIDIYISATTRSNNQIATIIIEVKGCWNKELKTAQETQLAMRYLRDRSSKEAVYLVAWFLCDKWDDSDTRKKQTPRWNKSQARTFFTEQSEQMNRDTASSIRAFVLDATIEGLPKPRKGKKKAPHLKRK